MTAVGAPSLGDLPIDLDRLMVTRALIQANSGGGKSWCLRRMLEQTAGHVQQLVLDPEGEFATLRERFDYIVCAPSGADAVATPATAAALARALWKAGTSAVLDIFELKMDERAEFVRIFCESLISAPRSMWHPTLIALDEVHIFAPQAGKCVSTGAVVDVATRGRKRGLSLLGATQRLSKLHKDVAAELLNKLIGRTGLDLDVQRAADELGMSRAAATDALRHLEPGDFFAYGPALSRIVTRTRIGPVVSSDGGPGHRGLAAPPPPSEAVRMQLAQLEGIQREVEQEADTVDALRAEVKALRLQVVEARRSSGGPEEEVRGRLAEANASSSPAGIDHSSDAALRTSIEKAVAALRVVDAELARRAAAEPIGLRPSLESTKTARSDAKVSASATPQDKAHRKAVRADDVALPATNRLDGPEQRILNAIAWFESVGVQSPEQAGVAFLAGYTIGGGAFNNPRGRLHKRGFVEYIAGGAIRLTESGRALAERPKRITSNADLHARVMDRLPGPEQRLLRPLLDCHPRALSNADLAAAARYAPGAGAFNNPRGRLRSLGLIDYPRPGFVVARDLLFPI